MHVDSWAQKAKQAGYRSRAVFKLEEILQTIKKIKILGNVLDLGAAPGGSLGPRNVESVRGC